MVDNEDRDSAGTHARARVCLVLQLLLALTLASPSSADEFSLISDSTVIGRNFGFPSGTPGQEPTPPGEVDLVLEAAVFFKNLELFGLDPINGETFFGLRTPLRLRYQASKRFSFELGAMIGQDFGDQDPLNVAEPLFRLGFEASPGVYIIAGNLLPTHWMEDALYDDALGLAGRQPLGMQLRVDRDHFKADLWINWRVRETALEPEFFEIAGSFRGVFLDDVLHLDLHAVWDHVGGQKTASERLEQNIGLYAGGSLGGALPFLALRGRVGGGYFYSIDDGRMQTKETGSGWQVKAHLERSFGRTIDVRLYGGWFRGNDLRARRGDQLYRLERYAQAGIELLATLPFGLRIEPGVTAQITDGRLNYTYRVFMSFGRGFPLRALRPRGLLGPGEGGAS